MNVPPGAGWLTDASAVQNTAFGGVPGGLGNGVGIGGYGANDLSGQGVNPNMQAALDPSMNMMLQQGHMGMDPSMAHFQGNQAMLAQQQRIAQLQQQQHMQRMQMQQNGMGPMPTAQSPGFPPQQQPGVAYPNPVVPMKRPRPREDSVTMSPRQANMGLPTSRSQTPLSQNQAMAYQMYQNGQQNPQRQFTPVQQGHLQTGSAEASPSPVMQGQNYPMQNGNAVGAKRMSTQSPSPYLQQGGFGMGQASPTAEQHISRTGTPAQSAHSPAMNSPLPPNTTMPPGSGPQQPVSAGYPSQFAATAQPQPVTPLQQRMPQPVMPNAVQPQQMTPQMQMQMQMQQKAMMQKQAGMQPGGVNPQQMMNSAMQAQRQNPMMAQQKSSDPNLFVKNLKDFMAKQGTPFTEVPVINNQQVNLMSLYTTVLRMGGSKRISHNNQWGAVCSTIGYPPEFAEQIAKCFQQYLGSFEMSYIARQHAMRNQRQPGQPQQGVPVQANVPQPPPPGQAMPPQTPVKQQHPQLQLQNGVATPQPGPGSTRHSTPHSQPPPTPKSMPEQSPSGPAFPPVPAVATKPQLSQELMSAHLQQAPVAAKEPESRVFKPATRQLDTHGGVNVKTLESLILHKPTAPQFNELGNIDIHALTMSLKSGITGEIRLALDTLATVSSSQGPPLTLQYCEDLVDSILDVADSNLELLAEHIETISDAIQVPSYEDILRGAKGEGDSLVEVARLGSLEYDLDRAAEKLICITTIFRNLSFFTCNHPALVDANVIKFISKTIELMGSKHLFFRTHLNTLDFMKDVIIFLSNVSQEIVLPSQDEAFNLLQLILAFAPRPLPAALGSNRLMFTPYQPAIHKYLPPAVDSLAKLLARDDPNRSFFKNIYLSESNSEPHYDLLTQSFAIAISPIPEGNRPLQIVSSTTDQRKPFLEQGMLAAEILSQICPGPESTLAREWLQSEDGFAGGLIRLVSSLGLFSKIEKHDDQPVFGRITRRGLTILTRLLEKTSEEPISRKNIHVSGLPTVDRLMGALLAPQLDPVVIKKLFELYGLN